MSQTEQPFTQHVLHWFDAHGRNNLPWQTPRTPYQVWISEVMLQQTQVKTVIPYFLRFMERFPSLHALAEATEENVLAYWSGLGYYRRGRNLPKVARIIQTEHHGVFPRDITTLLTLPGIGESTAAAILSLAFNQPAAILDGNVKRILSRYFLIGGAPEKASTRKALKHQAEASLPATRAADYTQAIMDLGALICTPKQPKCMLCPLQANCLAHKNNSIMNYPEKPKKKTLLIRDAQFLVLHNEENTTVYLEKRPSEGLWGGLWSLPNLDMHACPTDYVHQTHALHIKKSVALATIKHTFSHFKLNLHPHMICVCTNTLNQLLPQHGRWFHASSLGTLGLARPIQAILQGALHTDDAALLPKA